MGAHHHHVFSVDGHFDQLLLGYQNVLFQFFNALGDDIDFFERVGFFFSKFVQQLSQHFQAGHD